MDDHVTVFINNGRLREFFVPRHGTNGVQDGCMHASSPLSTDSTDRLCHSALALMDYGQSGSQLLLTGVSTHSPLAPPQSMSDTGDFWSIGLHETTVIFRGRVG